MPSANVDVALRATVDLRECAPFLNCRTVVSYSSEACASYVWQSHGARCEHHV
ncbi:hypothetical protein TW65_03795 [Stemphylium lycopersici]|nr:hypothetical protein TW65_03795 [Stemphylium lycopersici]